MKPLAGFLRQAHQHADKLADVSNIDGVLTKAIEDKNLPLFKSLFEKLPSQTQIIFLNGEMIELNLNEKNLFISPEDIENLKERMAKHISAAVSITNHQSTYSAESNNITSNTPVSIHSVGKVFTGILLMQMLRKGVF